MPSEKHRIEHAPILRLFAARLRELRAAAGLTQVALADRAGLTTNNVDRQEAATAAPGIDTLQKLATALGTAPHDLLPLGTLADPLAVLQGRGRGSFDELLRMTDRELMQVIVLSSLDLPRTQLADGDATSHMKSDSGRCSL